MTLLLNPNITTSNFRLLTYNTKSIRTVARLTEFEHAVSKLQFDIIGIAETWRSGRETLNLGSGFTLFASGRIDEAAIENFTYLGQLITQPRDQKREIGKRIACAWASFNKAKSLLTKRLVNMDTKRRYVQMCVVPALLYGCETWALTKANENRLARCQRAMERRILNIRLINKHPNKWIRQQTGQKDFVEAYRTRKWKHLHKMLSRSERWDKQLLDWTPAEKRPLGRPPTLWQDDFKKVAGSMWKQKAAQTTWLKEASAFATRQR